MIRLPLLLGLYGLTCSILWASPKVLNVYHWSGYLPEVVLQEFTKETGIKVNTNHYDSNEALYTKLKLIPSHGYDVIFPSSYTVQQMVQEGMLHPLDKSKILHFDHLNLLWLNKAYDPDNQYSLPYLFSVSGLIVNIDYHDPKVLTSWQSLWEQRFKHKLLLLDDERELFAITLLMLGFSPNTQRFDEIHQAYEKLTQLLKNVRVFNSEGIVDLYATEELTMGMGWNGDAYLAGQLNSNIHFIYPEEGYILSIDNIAIPRGAKHVAEAYQLINFLLRPDIAAKISLATGYGTTNTLALKYLPEQVLLNKSIYPDESILARGVIPLFTGLEQVILYKHYWERLKIAG
jgi:spermidine/putrescine transport system substrate-binding protein